MFKHCQEAAFDTLFFSEDSVKYGNFVRNYHPCQLERAKGHPHGC